MMKKSLLITILLGAALTLTGASSEGDGRIRLQEQTEKLSVHLLLEDWKAGFAHETFAPGAERIRQEMQQNAKECVRVADAQKLARGWFEAELQKQYRAGADRILKPFEKSLTKEEAEKLRSGEAEFFKQRTDALFGKTFQSVRSQLAAEQKKQVFRRIYPSADELEKNNDQQLVSLLTARFTEGLKQPLWEENEALIRREVIDPVIAAGRAQQSLQLHLVRRETVPASLWSQEEIADNLEKSVGKALAKQIPDPQKRYPLFTATKKQIMERAEHLPSERLMAALPRTLETGKYLAMLEQAPAEHKIPQKSFEKASPVFANELIAAAVKKTDAPQKYAADERVRKAAEQRYRALTPTLQKVRDQFAEKQLADYWPELAKGQWLPEMTETEAYSASGASKIPALKTRPQSAKLIRETERLTENGIRKALTKESIRLEAQRAAVKTVYQTVLETMENEQENRTNDATWLSDLFSKGSDITLEDVIKCYRKEVIRKSSEPLFPSVEKEIEVRARAILQRVLNPAVKKKSGGDSDLPRVVYTLYLSGSGDKLTLTCDHWKKTFTPSQVPSDEVAREIMKRIASVKEPSAFQVRLLVNGDRIYYRTVSEIRSKLKEMLKDCEIEDSMER